MSDDQRVTYSAEQFAAIVGVSTQAVYRAIERGEIPAFRIGDRRLIPKRVLDDLIASAWNLPDRGNKDPEKK